MSTNTFEVPAVDITPWVSGGDETARRAVAEAVDEACCRAGFMQIMGHGTPPQILADLAAAMDQFFELDAAAKMSYLELA